MTEANYYERVAEQLIEQLKAGMAPWQRPWNEASGGVPQNPVSGVRYKGGNLITLMSEGIARGYEDPRWLTYNQAASIGGQVRKGEKGTLLRFTKYTDQRPVLGEGGKPVFKDDGKPLTEEAPLEHPKTFSFVVFNAQQIDNLSPHVRPEKDFLQVERVEAILKKSGAAIHYGGQGAFYRPSSDTIHLPQRDTFRTEAGFYATALHELGHWTGHKSRLARDLAHPFGSAGYAKEELRAEIASMMLGAELGTEHDPSQHASYVGSWIKALEDDHREIFRAAADAERIVGHVLGLENRLEQVKTIEPAAPIASEAVLAAEPAAEKTLIHVPYMERHAAKNLGARWDKEGRSWFVQPGVDLAPFAKWQKEGALLKPQVSPIQEFAQVLKTHGLVVTDPVMNGTLQRVQVEGTAAGTKDGAYIGYLDGHPAGYFENFKVGTRGTWQAQGYVLSPSDRTKLRAEAEQILAQRQVDRAEEQEKRSVAYAALLKGLPEAHPDHPYLKAKGTLSHGVRQDGTKLLVPLEDLSGKIWSYQEIDEDGTKRFARGGKVGGCFHVIGEAPGALSSMKEVLITEGLATAATIHEATSRPVVVAFSAQNLKAVAEAVRESNPTAKIVLLGDDDRASKLATGINPGRRAAEAAAKSVGGAAYFPVFPAGHGKATDFNDLAKACGKDAVRAQVEAFISLGREREGKARPKEIAQTHQRRRGPELSL